VSCQGVENGVAVVRYQDGTLGRCCLPRTGPPPRAGDAALVSIRPERIRLCGAGELEALGTDGVMVSHTFLGRHSRSVIQALGQSLVVSTSDPLPVDATRGGMAVRLAWDVDDAQFLPGSR
jgi:hypothetical protein